MKKTTSTLLSMALVFSSFGALSAHAESLQKEKQFSPQLKTTIEQWGEHKIAQNVETKTTKEISVIVELQHAPLAAQSNIQHAPDLQNSNAQSYHAELKKALGIPVRMQYEINGNGVWEQAFLNPWEKSYDIYFDRTQLHEEKNTIHIVATDAAGNTSNLTVNLEVK
ncbi:serine protease [Bacillus sp. G3(2015)]|nr:serine protease [Bacillus sp. G3(2015)]